MFKPKSDTVFIIIIGILLINTFIQSQLHNYVLSLNNYLGLTSWLIVLTFQLIGYKNRRFALALIIIAGTFNILNFTIGPATIGFSIGSIQTNMLGFNPVTFLILLAYYIVNHKKINYFISNLFHGTASEREKEYQKELEFYSNKFKDLNGQELSEVVNDIDQYSSSAQAVIKELIKKTNL